jgi:hypothetical protein
MSAATGDASLPGRRQSSASRMRRCRDRRRAGLRSILFDIRQTEVEKLILRGLLAPDARSDPNAIAVALGRLLDKALG